MIDYAVNLGLRNVSEQWEASLKTAEILSSDITIRTTMDQQLSRLGLPSSWPSLMEDLKHDDLD